MENKINELIQSSNSPEEAFKKICEAYPKINMEDLKKQFEIEVKKAEENFSKSADSEEVENLSDNDLESVAGGSFGSWMKKNWPIVAGATAIVVLGVGGYLLGRNTDQNAAWQKGIEEGHEAGLKQAGLANPEGQELIQKAKDAKVLF